MVIPALHHGCIAVCCRHSLCRATGGFQAETHPNSFSTSCRPAWESHPPCAPVEHNWVQPFKMCQPSKATPTAAPRGAMTKQIWIRFITSSLAHTHLAWSSSYTGAATAVPYGCSWLVAHCCQVIPDKARPPQAKALKGGSSGAIEVGGPASS